MKTLLLSILFAAILLSGAGLQDKAIGQVVYQGLSPIVANIVNNCAAYDALQWVVAYDALSAAEQAQLIAALVIAQLTDLYMAKAATQGPTAASSFLATLPWSKQGMVVAEAAARTAWTPGSIRDATGQSQRSSEEKPR